MANIIKITYMVYIINIFFIFYKNFNSNVKSYYIKNDFLIVNIQYH